MDRQPTEEGTRYLGPPVDARGVIVKKRLPIGKARSLVELSSEFAFFTPAALYLHGRFFDGPLFDWMYELGRDVDIYCYRFQHPLFRGLENEVKDPGWNFGILAVPIEDWQAFAERIIGMVIADVNIRRYVAYGEQKLLIVDPLAVDFAGMWRPDLPIIEITGFGVEASDYRAAYITGDCPGIEPPTLRFFPPNPEIRAAAASYFRGGNPVMAREAFRAVQEKEKACQPNSSPKLPESGTTSLRR